MLYFWSIYKLYTIYLVTTTEKLNIHYSFAHGKLFSPPKLCHDWAGSVKGLRVVWPISHAQNDVFSTQNAHSPLQLQRYLCVFGTYKLYVVDAVKQAELDRLDPHAHSDAVPWSSTERKVRVWLYRLHVLVAEPFRVKGVRIWEEFRIAVHRVGGYDDEGTLGKLYIGVTNDVVCACNTFNPCYRGIQAQCFRYYAV